MLNLLPSEKIDFWERFIETGSINKKESSAQQYYLNYRVIDEAFNKDWNGRIQILNKVQNILKLLLYQRRYRSNPSQYKTINKIIKKINDEMETCLQYQTVKEVELACDEAGFKRSLTPGINNNCVLESITKTINRANGSDKENPKKAYEMAYEWQLILRSEAVELGFRQREGFYLESFDVLNTLVQDELTYINDPDLKKRKNQNFARQLRLNLDKNILNIWVFNYKTKKVYKYKEIKGLNVEKEGVSPVKIDILIFRGTQSQCFQKK